VRNGEIKSGASLICGGPLYSFTVLPVYVIVLNALLATIVVPNACVYASFTHSIKVRRSVERWHERE